MVQGLQSGPQNDAKIVKNGSKRDPGRGSGFYVENCRTLGPPIVAQEGSGCSHSSETSVIMLAFLPAAPKPL